MKKYIKINPKPSKPTFGVNPMDPWSTKSNISEDELDESAGLDSYLKSKGMNPKFVAKDTKISIAKSPAYRSWQQNHTMESVDSPTLDRAKDIQSRNKHDQIKTIPVKSTKTRIEEIKQSVQDKNQEQIDEVSAKKLLGYMMKAGSKKDPKKGTKDRSSNVMKATGKYLKTQEEVSKPEVEKFHKKLDTLVHKTFGKRKSEMGMKEGTVQHDPWKQKYFGPTKPTGRRASPEEMAKMKADDKRFSDAMASDMKRIDQDPKLNAMLGRKKVKEETYMDAKAATPSVMSPGEGISEKMTTAQRVMMLKKKKLKEDMHDHEKEDKSVATYGKKPKFEKADKDDSIGENKPTAAATMTGGSTLTGSKRDDVEIDPMMRNRPGQPDVTKGKDKKDDKDKDKKKDK
jgi:hypothetical protein